VSPGAGFDFAKALQLLHMNFGRSLADGVAKAKKLAPREVV
jgi:hypothetical protein